MEDSGAKQFAKYVNELRDKWGLSMNQLCEGLCSRRAAWYIEQGEREPGRMLREAILERLGVGAEDYECYLGCVEYAQWKMQHAILHIPKQLASSASGEYSLPEGFRKAALEGGLIYYMRRTYESQTAERAVFQEDDGVVDFEDAEVLFSVSSFAFEKGEGGNGSEEDVLAMLDTAIRLVSGRVCGLGEGGVRFWQRGIPQAS